jgi:hypothetical protein
MEQSTNLGATYARAVPVPRYTYSSNYAPRFKFLSWSAGAGKTFWAIKHCKEENERGTNCLIIVPTIDLAKQYVRDSDGLFTTIHSGDDEVNVIDLIHNCIKQQSQLHARAKTLVITEKAFEVLNPFIEMHSWILIKDEATEPLKIQIVKCKHSKEYVKSMLEFSPIGNFKSLSAVGFTDASPITDDGEDEILEKIQEFKRRLESAKLCVLVDKGWLDHNETPALKYCVFHRPELYRGYKKVIFMAAYFEDTFLYHAYKNAGVRWEELGDKSSRYIDTSRAVIHYYSELGAWSTKRRRESMDLMGVREIQKIIDWCNQTTGNKSFVYTINKEEEEGKLNGLQNGKLMPSVCHGMNSWSHHTVFLSLGSYLISGGDECFYRFWNLSTADGRGLRNTHMLYQQLMRTSLRDASQTSKVHIFVPTFTEALELLRYLPNATIQDCKKNENRPGEKTGISATLKSTWQRVQDEAIDTYNPSIFVSYVPSVYSKEGLGVVYHNNDAFLSDETDFKTSPDAEDQIIICKKEGGNKTFIPPQYLQTIQPEISTPEVVKKQGVGAPVRTGSLVLRHIMELCADISIKGMTADQITHVKQHKLRAFMTGQFPDASRFRSSDCSGNNDILGFDFDDTEVPLKKLLGVFKGLELLHYTTISDNFSSKQRRYRIVVAANRSMSLDEHERIMRHYQSAFEKLAKKLNVRLGLDISKLTPWSKFYMPHKESTKRHLKSRRKPLNVDECLADMPLRPIIISPTEFDLDYIYPTTSNGTISNIVAMNPLMNKCRGLINQMKEGNRSILACQVGGLAKHLSPEEQDEIFGSMEAKGVDKSAMKQARKYAKAA